MRAWVHKDDFGYSTLLKLSDITSSIETIIVREMEHQGDSIMYMFAGDLFERDNIVVERKDYSNTIINLTLII